MDLNSTKYLRFSIRWDTILLNLSNTDAIEEILHTSTFNHSRNDVEEMSFPHGVQVGEDRILNPESPAGGERRTLHGSGSVLKLSTIGILTQTLWFVCVRCMLWFSIYMTWVYDHCLAKLLEGIVSWCKGFFFFILFQVFTDILSRKK